MWFNKLVMRNNAPLNAVLVFMVAFATLFGSLMPAGQQAFAADLVSPVVIVEDFEKGLEGNVRFDQRRNFSGSMSLESDSEHVRNGNHSVRIDYDYIGVKENPSYVYIGPPGYTIPVQGYPKKIGMWLYGNNDGHEIYSKFRDGKDKSFEVQFVPETGVNWTGWKYIEADLPQDKPAGLVMEIYMRIEQSDFQKKNKGTVWVDDVRLIYADNSNEDTMNPTLEVLSPKLGETVSSDRPTVQLLAADDKSGIDPTSIRMKLDGQTVTADYDAGTGFVSYTPERLASGYHTVQASVYDGMRNPTQQQWSFNIDSGPQYKLEAPTDVISNAVFPLQVKLEKSQTVTGAYTEIGYDPKTLELVGTETLLPDKQVLTREIDNVNGIFKFGASELASGGAVADQTLITLNFKVKASARMERGEAFKQIVMLAGSLEDQQGDTLQASAMPHAYKIEFPYHLKVDGVSLGTTTTIRVTDDKGLPVEGVSILLPDIFGPQGSITVSNNQTTIYKKDQVSSAPLLTVPAGVKLFADAENVSATFYSVYLPDGSGKGWVQKSDAGSYSVLKDQLGKTNGLGEIRISGLTLALTTLQLQAEKGDFISEAYEMGIVPQLGTEEPEYVNTYMTQNPKTTQSIVWQTAPRIENTVIQYAPAEGFLGFDKPGAIELAVNSKLMLAPKKVGEIRYHQALLNGLKPGTEYRYRVGYEGHWSNEHVFTTEPESNDPFSFLFVTDSHTNSEAGRNIYRDLMDKAFADNPDTRFVMHGGDIVDDGGVMDEWTNFLKATESYSGSIPSAYTMGNHDVKNGGKLVLQNVFGLPENGMEGQNKLTYSYDYGDAHFVVLNSEADEIDMVKQASWLRADLKASTKKWKFAMFHRTPYHTEAGRGEELVTRYIAPVLEELGVDLVLVGHDHALAWTYPMKEGKPQSTTSPGTVYLVGGASGWKFYDAVKHDYLEFLYDEDVPVYSSIQVEKDKLIIRSHSTDGKLVAEKVVEKRTESPGAWTGGGTTGPVVSQPGITINEQQLAKLVQNKTYEIELGDSGDIVNLPINTAELLGGHALTLRFGKESVTLTPELLKSVGTVIDWKSIRITVSKKQSKSDNLLSKAASRYVQVGGIVTVSVGGVTSKNEWQPLTTGVPIELDLTANAGTDLDLIGLYAIGSDGNPVYISGTVPTVGIRTIVQGNGQYALLEYHASYSDVGEQHWAKRIIDELSAKHLVEGIDETRFAPERSITRAEFVTMLVRKLGLTAEADGSKSFNDVVSTAWYAGAVAAATKAQLVQGTEKGEFRQMLSSHVRKWS